MGLGTGNLKEGAFIKLEPSGLRKYFAFGGYGCDSHIRSEVLMKAVERAGKMLRTEIKTGRRLCSRRHPPGRGGGQGGGYHSAA